MKVTYNQVIKELKAFFDSHYQVQEFRNGDLWEALETNSFDDALYPLAFLVDNSVTTSQGSLSLSFDLLIMDLVDKGEDSENEVKSDTLLYITDTISYLEQLRDGDWYSVQVNKSATANSFTEDLADGVTGWKATITLSQPFNYNACSIPYSGVSHDGDVECEPVTITDSDGVTIVEVASGGNFSCTQIEDSLYNPVKTGDSSYIQGDDGETQAGRNVDKYTLDFVNPFGNTMRFTNDLGGSHLDNSDGSTAGYFIDNATRLGYCVGINGTITAGLLDAQNHTQGSYSGFRVANLNEFVGIMVPGGFYVDPYLVGYTQSIWLINKLRNSTSVIRAYSNQLLQQVPITNSYPMMYVRNHIY